LKLRELINIPDIGEINRDNLEFILRDPSLLANAENYKERVYQLITKVEQDIVIAQNSGVSIDEYLGINNEGIMTGLAGETIPNVMIQRHMPQPKPTYSQQSTHIHYKMDSDTSNYYELTNCPVCFEELCNEKRIAFNCAHAFCTDCAPSILKTKNCPICRESIKQIRFTSDISSVAFNSISSL
jgi:hypothetical protein